MRQFTWTRRISAPASARARVIACPIPRVPPVTKAVCPSSENIDENVAEDAISKVMMNGQESLGKRVGYY